ncbi:MAG: diguanylate cyclase [Sulfurimonas sp.]|nr:diguanylate cyclase [Sulfurimonas sp.]
MSTFDICICDYPILLVDDDRFMQRITEDALVRLGYRVDTAANGKIALKMLEKGDYPLVISDWVMPEMDGVELCRAIRDSHRQQYTYIILLTSQARQDDIIKGLEAGADEYLVKPVNPAELTVRIKTARRIIDLERSLQRSLGEIKRLSLTDALTGVFNRRYLDDRLLQELKRAYRYERPLSIAMLDLDHFKAVNDRYGHQAGDTVLRVCASQVRESIRGEVDWLARYGGEEFVVVLPETELNGALIVAERLRKMISGLIISEEGHEIRVSTSIGVASHTPIEQHLAVNADQLIHVADTCLYQAKQNGRNQVKGIAI